MSVSLKTKNPTVEGLLDTSSLLEEVISSKANSDDLKTVGTIALGDFTDFVRDQKSFVQYPELSRFSGINVLDDRIVGMSKNLLTLIQNGVLAENDEVMSLVVPFAQDIIKRHEHEQSRLIHKEEQQEAKNRGAVDPVQIALESGKPFTSEDARKVVGDRAPHMDTHDVLVKHAQPKYIKNLIGQFRAYANLQSGGSFDRNNTKNEAIIGLKSTFMFFLESASGKNASKMDELTGHLHTLLRDSEKADYEILVNGLVAEYITGDILKNLKAKGKIKDFRPADAEHDANEGTDFFVNIDLQDEITGSPEPYEVRIDAKSAGGFALHHSLGKEMGQDEEFFDMKQNNQGDIVVVFCPDRSKKRPMLKNHKSIRGLKRFDSYKADRYYRHMLTHTGDAIVSYIEKNKKHLN